MAVELTAWIQDLKTLIHGSRVHTSLQSPRVQRQYLPLELKGFFAVEQLARELGLKRAGLYMLNGFVKQSYTFHASAETRWLVAIINARRPIMIKVGDKSSQLTTGTWQEAFITGLTIECDQFESAWVWVGSDAEEYTV